MGNYCTRADMLDRFGAEELIQLTDRPNPETREYAGVIDEAVLARALADAAAEIDGYLAGRYPTPLDPVPDAIARYACDIARYQLYATAPTDNVKKRYDDARKYLLEVGKGVIGLRDTEVPPQSSNGARMQSGGRVFGRNDNGFI